MEKQITVRIKNVYGNELVYPVCEAAKRFASLTNTKTFSHRNLCDIEALGFLVVVEAQKLAA